MPPSLRHEILVHFFREWPALAADLLSPAGGALSAGEVRVAEATFSQLVPAQFAADLVVLVGDPPRLGIVLEAQLRQDADKRFTWRLYAAGLRARWRCPVAVLVYAPDPEVAAWAAEPIALGPGPTEAFRPHVVGPGDVPLVTSPERARTALALAVFSAMVRGNGQRGRRCWRPWQRPSARVTLDVTRVAC